MIKFRFLWGLEFDKGFAVMNQSVRRFLLFIVLEGFVSFGTQFLDSGKSCYLLFLCKVFGSLQVQSLQFYEESGFMLGILGLFWGKFLLYKVFILERLRVGIQVGSLVDIVFSKFLDDNYRIMSDIDQVFWVVCYLFYNSNIWDR